MSVWIRVESRSLPRKEKCITCMYLLVTRTNPHRNKKFEDFGGPHLFVIARLVWTHSTTHSPITHPSLIKGQNIYTIQCLLCLEQDIRVQIREGFCEFENCSGHGLRVSLHH